MKRSVLPILAVLGLVWAAFACASASAESTVLCKVNEEPCKAANVYPEGTAIVAEATGATDQVKIAMSGVTIKCPSKLEGTVGSGSEGTELLSVSSWSLGNSTEGCTGLSNSGDCGTASGEGLPYTAEITNESIGVSGLSWHLSCKMGSVTYINCTYHEGLNHPGFTVDHKAITYTEYSIQHTGSACGGALSRLSGTFRIVKPAAAIYVSWVEAPIANTEKPTLIRATSATLNGTVNPEGIATSYWFEYGTGTGYGSKTSTFSAGSGSSNVAVSKSISGLTVDTTYHYRLVAEDEFGLKSYGNDMTVGAPTYRSSFGSGGTEEDQFVLPAGIAVDSSGNVWVAEVTGRIEKWSPSGEFLFAFGKEYVEGEEVGESPLSSPSAIAIDSEGHLLVTDPGNGRIEEFNAEGEFLFAFGEYDLVTPEGIAIDPEGHIWVADRTGEALKEFDSEGNWMLTKSGNFERPRGVAIRPNSEGFDIYVADSAKNRIIQYRSNKAILAGKPFFVREWGALGEGNGQLSSPDALATDSEGNVWVMDKGNGRVQEFTASGEYIAKFAPTQGGFFFPGGIATDSDGSIWFSNAHGYQVERWSR